MMIIIPSDSSVDISSIMIVTRVICEMFIQHHHFNITQRNTMDDAFNKNLSLSLNNYHVFDARMYWLFIIIILS